MSEQPKLYTSSEIIANEWRKLYPGVEVVITPKSIPLASKLIVSPRQGNYTINNHPKRKANT